jgi:hypothetical protein
MSPARGLWVATLHGEHAGMVERMEGRYHARNARGRELGSFEDLDSARAAIDGGDGHPAGEVGSLTIMIGVVNAVAVAIAVGLAVALLR